MESLLYLLLGALGLLGVQYVTSRRRASEAEKELIKKTFEVEEKDLQRRVLDAEASSDLAAREAHEKVSNFRTLFDRYLSRKGK